LLLMIARRFFPTGLHWCWLQQRSRALNRGAEPRLDVQGLNASDLALQEIAWGAFSKDEVAPLLFESTALTRLPAPNSTTTELRGNGCSAPQPGGPNSGSTS
jgi:hypothetical protein